MSAIRAPGPVSAPGVGRRTELRLDTVELVQSGLVIWTSLAWLSRRRVQQYITIASYNGISATVAIVRTNPHGIEMHFSNTP